MDTLTEIKNQIAANPVILYMKGSPAHPQCGFSKKAADILNSTGVEYAYVDILANPEIRATLPSYANWPTFPQLYIQGELIGGCDIMTELAQTGELQKRITEVSSNQN